MNEMNKESFKAYILKYATTSGVMFEEVRACGPGYETSVAWRQTYFHGNQWTTSKNIAWQIIQEVFDKKRKSLEKQLAKLNEKKRAALQIIDTTEL